LEIKAIAGQQAIRKVVAGIGLGANLGDAAAQVEAAIRELDRLPETKLMAVSGLYRTAPVGKTDQDWFVNAAAVVETGLGPRAMLEALLDVENRMGRVRVEKWGPRRIDLDLLFYGSATIREENLSVPHPYLHQRRFVLAPLAEIAPDWVHPELGLTVREMSERLADPDQEVHRPWA
jgi:2-amino-4-hydroxy-6-hydroxymethyldihydropteridine diphosphokinase